MQESSTVTLAPISASERIPGVDIARGIALLGIILVNARFFFLPMSAAYAPALRLPGTEQAGADMVAYGLVDAFCSFKFISLFSMLFGFGFAMQAARTADAGVSRWGPGLRRLALLLAVGLVHGFVVWSGDILTIYAVIGVVVLACARLSPRFLLIAAGISATIGFLFTTGALFLTYIVSIFPEPVDPPELTAAIEAMQAAAEAEAASEPAPLGWDAMVASRFDVASPEWMRAETVAAQQGPWTDALLFRGVLFVLSFINAMFSYAWHSLAMMLFGAYAFRSGLFAGTDEGSRRRRKLLVPTLAVGLPVSIAAPIVHFAIGPEHEISSFVSGTMTVVGALFLPIAYACAIVEWGPRLPRFIAMPLERTGRMALTVYLAESIVCTALASWWGLALFGTMSDARISLIAIGVWVGLVLAATLWLQRFRIGPMEWVWRSATYARNPA